MYLKNTGKLIRASKNRETSDESCLSSVDEKGPHAKLTKPGKGCVAALQTQET